MADGWRFRHMAETDEASEARSSSASHRCDTEPVDWLVGVLVSVVADRSSPVVEESAISRGILVSKPLPTAVESRHPLPSPARTYSREPT